MKRFILIIDAIFLSLILRAQSVTYTCRYWFDQNHTQTVTTTFNESTWQAEIDIGLLPDGLHILHVHVMDTSLQWSVPQSYIFMKAGEFLPNSGNTGNLTYHCWFDEDFEHQQINSLGDGSLLLNVDDLEDGLHTVHVMLEGSTLTATQSYTFMKIAVEAPNTELQYTCWFDQDYDNAQTGPLGSGIFELEVGDLANGIHTVNVQLNNGSLTAPQTYVFYKRPMERYTIARWEYWINDNFDNRTTTNLSPTVDTIDILSLLPVGHPAIRSSCFHFHPNGDEPYINAKNQITFRFFDNEYRFFDKSALYVDYQVSQSITAQIFERNTTETFTAPRNNQITWYKLDAVVGDSLAFVADKACTMHLFAPSGEEVYSVSGSESIKLGGCHAWENGTYYLAVHDVMGSGETVSVTYQWIAKYVVLAYTPTEIGNNWGVFQVDVLGNGFDKLNNVILTDGFIEWQMDTIMDCHISQSAIRFVMDSTTYNGNYDVVLCFEDQVGELDTLVLSNAIQVVEAQFGTIDIDYSYQFSTTPPHLITVTITNNGNVEYQGVPVIFAHTNINNVNFDLYNDWITVQDDYFENGGTAIYYTNNLFNQGIEGNIIPLIIPRLGPYSTRVITLKVDVSLEISFDFYAWGGIPWSVKTEEAYNADDYYCQTHPDSPGWNGNHNGGNGGNSGITHGSSGGSSGGASYSVGTYNSGGGNTHGSASDLFFDGCDGIYDFCKFGGFFGAYGCLCGVISATGKAMMNSIAASMSEHSRRSLMGFQSQEEAEEVFGDIGTYWWNSAYNTRLAAPGSLYREAVFSCIPMPGDVVMSNLIQDAVNQTIGLFEDDCSQPRGQNAFVPMPCEPNEIRGYLAESGSHYMMQEIQTITYEIESENDTTATAAAHTIIVRDTLDVNKFDVASLAAHRVTIGNKVMNLNGENSFIYTLDLRPELYVIVQIQQECDVETGIVQWTITSLDPMTMEPTTDPYQGALPINYNGEGIATFTYSVNLKEPFPDGTEISNRAGIIFDQNDVILTPIWTNIVDAVKPVSQIEEVSVVADTLNFNFISSDNRSGVWYHSLYYRNEATEQEWKVKVPKILENNCLLHFDEYQTTEYLVIAVDSAGNVEDKDMVAEYIHYYDGPAPVTQTINLSQGWNWISIYVDNDAVDLLELFETELCDNGVQIKSKTLVTAWDEDEEEWTGSLQNVGLSNDKTYLVQTTAACQVTLVGQACTLDNYTITLNPGWNWIGFPSEVAVSVEEAFSGFEAVEGDEIKSKTFVAGWDSDEEEWSGTLTVLTPGQGYMFYSATSGARTLTFQTGSKTKSPIKP